MVNAFVRMLYPIVSAIFVEPPESAAPPAAGVVRAGIGAAVDGYLRRYEAYGFNGAVLVAKDGEVVLEQGYGYADESTGRRVTPTTPFLIASLSKPLTAAAVLKLEADGRLSTLDALGEHFAGVPADKAQIRVHQLLSHTSGLDDEYRDLYPQLTDDAYLDMVWSRPLTSSPGSRFRYSNFGYFVLREIIERTSGRSYERYLRDALLEPAGMRRTGFELPSWEEEAVALYQDRSASRSERYPENPLDTPKAWMIQLSTVGDLYRWHLALEAGSVLPDDARDAQFEAVRDGYGLGWRVGTTSRGTRLHHHGGYDTAFGIAAGFYHYVDEGVVVILLANTILGRTLSHESLMHELEGLVFGGTVAMPPPPVSVDPARIRRFVGTYELVDGDAEIEITVDAGRLTAYSDDPLGVQLLMLPDTFSEGGAFEVDETLVGLFARLGGGERPDLESVLWRGSPVDAVEHRLSGMSQAMVQRHGAYVGCRSVHERRYARQGTPETQVFVALDFERGTEVVRALRNPAGRWWFDTVGPLEEAELGLAPAGEHDHRSWNLRLGLSARFRFVVEEDSPVRLEVSGRRSTTTLVRR